MGEKRYQAWRFTQIFFGELLAAALACTPCFLLPVKHANLELMAGVIAGASVYLGIWCAFTTSGGHINPMVTLAAVLTRRVSILVAPVYFVGQFSGTLIACAIGWFVSPYAGQMPGTYGLTLPGPNVSVYEAALVETMTTFSLIIVVLASLDELRGRAWRMENGNNFPFAMLLIICVNVALSVSQPF